MPAKRPAHPMSNRERAKVGGLTKLVRHGPEAYREMGLKGTAALDARIARDAGIDPNAEDYAVRLRAARRLYFMRLAEGRWSREHRGRGTAAAR
jgi:hypothetical protein